MAVMAGRPLSLGSHGEAGWGSYQLFVDSHASDCSLHWSGAENKEGVKKGKCETSSTRLD